jgi:hypothetical protein
MLYISVESCFVMSLSVKDLMMLNAKKKGLMMYSSRKNTSQECLSTNNVAVHPHVDFDARDNVSKGRTPSRFMTTMG